MSDKKQTAVEWFVEKMNLKYGNNDFAVTFQNEISQALQMEKEQSKDIFIVGFDESATFEYAIVAVIDSFNEYYKETYGK